MAHLPLPKFTEPQNPLWHNVSFTPAGPGWRAIYLDPIHDNGYFTHALAGWLVQEQVEYHDALHLSPKPPARGELRHRRVIAADADAESGEVMPAENADNFYRIAGPGEPDPTPEQIADAHREYAEKRLDRQHPITEPAETGARSDHAPVSAHPRLSLV
jgi:hypothetical protein